MGQTEQIKTQITRDQWVYGYMLRNKKVRMLHILQKKINFLVTRHFMELRSFTFFVLNIKKYARRRLRIRSRRICIKRKYKKPQPQKNRSIFPVPGFFNVLSGANYLYLYEYNFHITVPLNFSNLWGNLIQRLQLIRKRNMFLSRICRQQVINLLDILRRSWTRFVNIFLFSLNIRICISNDLDFLI